MNGEQLRTAVSESEGTALSRLGSDKYLIAATGATLETPAVLAVGAASAATGRDCFDAWAEASEGGVADAFAAAADEERDQYDRIVAEMDGDFGDPAADHSAAEDPVREVLERQDRTIERVAAGFVGRGLVRERTTLQVVNFFINEGDEGRADLFRTVRGSAADDAEVGGDLLEMLCEDDADWERARVAAESVVEVAYEDYASTLESMGVNPKPVC
jgi:hypothetical protein